MLFASVSKTSLRSFAQQGLKFTLVLAVALSLFSCATQTVKTTTITSLEYDQNAISEDELLDIGVAIFNPGLEDLDTDDEELTFGDVRMAETFFVSNLIAETLQSSANWGVVRVIPHDLSSSDLAVRGTILQSDGETMRLYVNVIDSTGITWIDKEYKAVVSRFSYDPRQRRTQDAFQGLYNEIANDILLHRQQNLSRDELLTIRAVSQIQFAKNFAPQVYDDYLEESPQGILQVKRLPANNDAILGRIETIRERDNLYVDTLQAYYINFSRDMEQSYTEYRRISYDEVLKLDRLQRDARRNMVMGFAAIVGGLAATRSNNAGVYYSSPVVIGAGAWLIRDAFNTRDQAQMHVEALAELGHSLETEIAPQTIELQEQTITLSGSVETQYQQWREILTDIYANETGEAESSEL